MTIQAYAAYHAKDKLVNFEYEPKPLQANQVEVSISHCGVCHSDIHLIDNDWGVNRYPLVPGHEIVGTVSALGADVKHLKMGQRVGIGWQCDSCGTCEWCTTDQENVCAKQKATCIDQFGGYANKISVNARFAIPIPEGLSSESVAPLFCGGITVFSPLHKYVTKPGMQVGIVGIGGLGHMALQFAKALGANVTAFSHTAEKADEAKSFGADDFVLVDNKSMLAQTGRFDFILVTSSAPIDMALYLNALKPKGVLCVVGAPSQAVQLSVHQLIAGRKSICGSNIGAPKEIEQMLNLALKHGIKAKTESMPMANVNDAVDKVRDNGARYRMVLTV